MIGIGDQCLLPDNRPRERQEDTMRWRSLGIMVVAMMLVAACGSGDTGASSQSSTTAATAAPTQDAPETTSPATTSTTVASEDDLEILRDEGIEYHSDGDGSWTMDVLYPSEPGDWPLVIVYHGMSTQRSTVEARRIAQSGAVAVAPQWIKEVPPSSRDAYIDGGLYDRAACATSVAQQVAADYGADPSNTTVAGFSAGVHPAAWVGLGVVREDVCDAPIQHKPLGVVLGDSQLIFYEEGWDESFADPSSNAKDTADRFVNPDRWDMPDDVAVYLWSTDFRHGRAIENPPGDDSWIWVRDTTGTLVEDFEALGAIESEWIGFMENGQLIEERMRKAGIDVTHEAVGGDHRYSEPVYEGIDGLIHRDRGSNSGRAWGGPTGATAENGYEWPSPRMLEGAALFVCDDLNALGFALHEEANLVDVGEQSWDTDMDEIVRGGDAVLAAMSAKGIGAVECGDKVLTLADYVAVPVSTTNDDGSGSEGIWVLKVSEDGAITWINMYMSELESPAPPSSTDDAKIAEARAFCGTIEGTGYVRDAEEFLAFMADDPTAQAIPNGYHVAGDDGIRSMIKLYPPGDNIACEEGGITNGVWSATGTALTNTGYSIYLEGITVHQHTPDGINDLYYHWTDAGMSPGWDAGTWGMPPNP